MSNPFYSISGQTTEEIVAQLNLSLSNISDRLDAIEGKRGAAKIDADLTITGQLLILDVDGNEIQGFKDS